MQEEINRKATETERRYPYKIELHAHTSPVSACAHISPEEAVQLYAARGADALVITNHLNPNWMVGDPHERALEYLADVAAARREGERCGVHVILGCEIRFTENANDYLIYGLDESDIEAFIAYLDRGIADFYKAFRRPDRLILQAHPYRKNMVLSSLDTVDGIEVFNMHPNHNSRVGLAAQYAREHDLPISGGSDFHDPGNEALCLLRSATLPKTSYDIAALLRSRDFYLDVSGFLIHG